MPPPETQAPPPRKAPSTRDLAEGVFREHLDLNAIRRALGKGPPAPVPRPARAPSSRDGG